ncbi:Potassium voltage-gated channel sub KQT member 4 [Blomia tropicalis]|nr:Potassium voltage-gated channel sub KQT member 4 [Blomia tropicalis]
MSHQSDKDNPKTFHSRFKVTPRVDIESQMSFDQNQTNDNSNNSLPSSPTITMNGNTFQSTHSPLYGPYTSLADYFQQMEYDQCSEEKNQNVHLNTATTTSTSSSSSFYNTIYKYNKLKQSDHHGSLDAVYFPVGQYNRRSSKSPHSSIGISFYNERVHVYNFLQRPTGLFAITYHISISIAVIYCLVLTILSTSSHFTNSISKWLNMIDYIIITFFIVEFLARLWASECVSYYRGWRGRARFFKNPIRIIDLFVIIISLAVLISNEKGELLITSLRGVRFIQIFQMVRLDFKFRPWRLMMGVIYSQRIHLAIVFYMGFLALIFISFVIYFVEKNDNPAFDSLASSMWWAVITLCTIGYGDMYPKTSTGKFLACVCSLIGVSIFALPAGILGTGLALKVQEQQRQLKMSKRKQPAARLIQCAWKFYKCEQDLKRSSMLIHMNGQMSKDLNNPVNEINRSIIWKRFGTGANKGKSRPLVHKEMNAIQFMFAVKLCIAKRDFVKAFKPYDIKDVLEQYAAGHADMLAKIRIMDHRLEKIQSNNVSAKVQHEFRLRFASHLTKLEFEIQRIQFNMAELLQTQNSTKVLFENLMKYLINHKQQQAYQLTSNLVSESKFKSFQISSEMLDLRPDSKERIRKRRKSL